MECWTCGSRRHVDNDCPCRVPGVPIDPEAATTTSDATTTAAPAVTSPALANAQVSRDTGRACPDPGGENGNYRLNGEDRKESRQVRPPPEEDRPRLGSKQESERRAANARDQAGTTVGTETGAAWPEAAATAGETLAANPAPEATLSPWVQALVNTKTEMSASGLRRAGRSLSASSLSRLSRHQPHLRPQPLLFSESGAFSGRSPKNALARRRSVAAPRTGAGTRRAGFSGLRAASVRRGTGLNARGFSWTGQGATDRRRARGVTMRSRREQGKGPRCISGAVVAYQAAKHAVEDLCSATPAQLGALLLAFAFAVSASDRTLFLTHCGIVLGVGVTLWIRASPPRPLQPGLLAYDPDASRRPRRAQPWVDAEEDDEMKGVAGTSGRRSREKGGVISVENTRRLLMALVLTWFAVDAVSVLCFFGLARSIENRWLALALLQASVVYAVWVGASVASKGPKKLEEKTTFRYLVTSWHLVLILTVAAARMAAPAARGFPGWDRAAFREGVGSALVAAAAWQLARIGRRRVERSARYGMVVALGKVLRSVDHDRQLSEESMLELAFGRWLVDYWSQPPRFSAVDMRSMLGQAASSIAKGELRGRSTPPANVFGSDAALDWSDRSSMEAASAASGLIGALMEYLKERPSNVRTTLD